MSPSHHTQLNTTNPFPCDLKSAQNAFFQTLLAVQRQKLSLRAIDKAYQELAADLDKHWNELEGLAFDGLVDRMSIELGNFMKEIGCEIALRQFLNGATKAWDLSPTTPGLQNAVADKLACKHQEYSSLLLQILTKGTKEREEIQRREAENLAQTHIQLTEQSVERVWQSNQQLYQMLTTALDKLNEHSGFVSAEVQQARDDARNSLEDARKSLELAMRGTRQVQDAFPLIMGPAVDLVKSVHQHMQQQLPSAIETGVVRAENRRTIRKLLWIGIPVAVIFLIMFLCTLMGTHLLVAPFFP